MSGQSLVWYWILALLAMVLCQTANLVKARNLYGDNKAAHRLSTAQLAAVYKQE